MENSSTAIKQVSASTAQLRRIVTERSVYAIVDPSCEAKVPSKLWVLPCEQGLSLFAGTRFEEYSAVAPYLLKLDATLLDWIASDLWSLPWGVLIFSNAPMTSLFLHFRRFLHAFTPDATPIFFRYFDSRILPTFLASPDAAQFGFWHQVAAFGWAQDDAAVLVQWNGLPVAAPILEQPVILSDALLLEFKKKQMQNFFERMTAYLTLLGTLLPAEPEPFLQSIVRYAVEAGIQDEVDLIRFIVLVTGWHQMNTVPAACEILTYPELPGSDKVDLLCELAAFGGYAPTPAEAPGLDREAHHAALAEFMAKHKNDAQFLRVHPNGILTSQPYDARWRKEWVLLYSEKVAARAHVAHVPIGTAVL